MVAKYSDRGDDEHEEEGAAPHRGVVPRRPHHALVRSGLHFRSQCAVVRGRSGVGGGADVRYDLGGG